jgi:uncharacterized RDD family membrane protein YckC
VPLTEASLRLRVASLLYEALLLTAVLWCATLPVAALESSFGVAPLRAVYQFYLALVAGIYFVSQWTRGGQTLAMKTWHLRLVAREGAAITLSQAALRYVIALVGLACLGAGFLWAFIDRDRRFLHDRVAGTCIVRVA